MDYKFKVLNSSGRVEKITVVAENEALAFSELRNRNLKMLDNLNANDNNTSEKKKFLNFKLKQKFNYYQFIDKLAPLLEANVTLERALQIIYEGSELSNAVFTGHINNFLLKLHDGEKFSSIIRESGLFPPLYGHLLEAGEQTGCLTEVVKELQRFSESSKELKDFLITSAIYPVLILTVVLIVIMVLFFFVMPQFANIFTQMGKEPPVITQIMIALSKLFIMFWWLIPAGIIGVITLLNYVKKGGKAKVFYDKCLLKIPILNKLLINIEMNRFIATLALLTANHVHLLTAVEIGSKVISNSLIKNSFRDLTTELRGGVKFSKALAQSPYVPRDLLQLLIVSEETGNVGKMLKHNARQLDRGIKSTLKRLLALFEPLMIIVLAIIVLTVVVAVLLAVLELNAI